ncbi:hypothetical protein [Methylorubrum thiocyanatum]|uniref:Uncharacterized protein n=1 Tax=Methylorubrum thiocyanatum TaxID=47958 RepID=A0AA40S3J4_9HYPH|nr:hypothetical protein [Methylorubrum thiocyanatum]MBA8913813.1 hypothetical protein [Methylorubrum thiocyanatum]
MADSNPTVGELFKAKAVTDEQVIAAVDAYRRAETGEAGTKPASSFGVDRAISASACRMAGGT